MRNDVFVGTRRKGSLLFNEDSGWCNCLGLEVSEAPAGEETFGTVL